MTRHIISNGAGDCAPAVWCVTCTKQEMPINGEEFIVWRVEGLCVGGYGVSGSKNPGYIIFLVGGKDEAGAEKKRYHLSIRQ